MTLRCYRLIVAPFGGSGAVFVTLGHPAGGPGRPWGHLSAAAWPARHRLTADSSVLLPHRRPTHRAKSIGNVAAAGHRSAQLRASHREEQSPAGSRQSRCDQGGTLEAGRWRHLRRQSARGRHRHLRNTDTALCGLRRSTKGGVKSAVVTRCQLLRAGITGAGL